MNLKLRHIAIPSLGFKQTNEFFLHLETQKSEFCKTQSLNPIFAPEDLGTFYKQRRRWGPSTTANVWELILSQRQARKNNPYISMPYIIYHLLMLIFSQIGVSTTIMMVAEAFSIGIGMFEFRKKQAELFIPTSSCEFINEMKKFEH